jgi:hypothetical protein
MTSYQEAPNTALAVKKDLCTCFPPNIWPSKAIVFDDIKLKRAFIDTNGGIFSAGRIFAMLQNEGIVRTGGSALSLHQSVDALRMRVAEESDEVVVAQETVRSVVAGVAVAGDDGAVRKVIATVAVT